LKLFQNEKLCSAMQCHAMPTLLKTLAHGRNGPIPHLIRAIFSVTTALQKTVPGDHVTFVRRRLFQSIIDN